MCIRDSNSSVPFTSSRKLERAGTLTIQMKLSVENGLVVATLTDQNGEPVADYPVDLYLSGVKQRSQQSDSSGRVTSVSYTHLPRSIAGGHHPSFPCGLRRHYRLP